MAQLNQQQLPEARSLREKEQQRRDELTASTQLLQAKCGELREEIRKLEVLAPKLEEEVRSERVVYDALTASCTASSKELENLERQIGELRSNNDGEKLVIYRKQLEERQQELKEIQAECARIELENAQAQKALEAGQNERARLQELKRRHTSGIEVTEKQLRELAFAGTNAYLQAVETLESRMKLLEGVRGKLAQSIANMRKALGCAPIEESVSLEEQVKLQLRELLLRTDDLRCALVACANSINMEER